MKEENTTHLFTSIASDNPSSSEGEEDGILTIEGQEHDLKREHVDNGSVWCRPRGLPQRPCSSWKRSHDTLQGACCVEGRKNSRQGAAKRV
jgi:hypothetical protein